MIAKIYESASLQWGFYFDYRKGNGWFTKTNGYSDPTSGNFEIVTASEVVNEVAKMRGQGEVESLIAGLDSVVRTARIHGGEQAANQMLKEALEARDALCAHGEQQ